MERDIPKYPRTPYWPWSPSVAEGDRRITEPERFVGCDVAITEKLDGGNTLLHNGLVYARSTAAPAEHPWMAKVKQYHAWRLAGEDSLYLYGEDVFGVHSIRYDPLPENRTFFAFGLRIGERFVPYDILLEAAEMLDVQTAPEVFRGSFSSVKELDDFIAESHRQPSVLGGEREGVVVRHAQGFSAGDFADHVCKSVRPNHVQTNQHWSLNWRPCELLPVAPTGDPVDPREVAEFVLDRMADG